MIDYACGFGALSQVSPFRVSRPNFTSSCLRGGARFCTCGVVVLICEVCWVGSGSPCEQDPGY